MPSFLSEKKRKNETVIFFDWDDTLIPSTFLSSRGYRLDTDADRLRDVEPALRELEHSVLSVLRLAMSFGEVHIVTNAETGWVQLSAQKFLPGLVPMLEKVEVLSARSTYEGMFPDSPLKWKFYAFQQKLANSFADAKSDKNILSFGDSHVEREAVRAVTRGFPHTTTKSVKFAERPSLEQLRRQIELVTNCFQYIHHHDGDLDLQLTVTVNSPTSASGSANNTAAHTGAGSNVTGTATSGATTQSDNSMTDVEGTEETHTGSNSRFGALSSLLSSSTPLSTPSNLTANSSSVNSSHSHTHTHTSRLHAAHSCAQEDILMDTGLEHPPTGTEEVEVA